MCQAHWKDSPSSQEKPGCNSCCALCPYPALACACSGHPEVPPLSMCPLFLRSWDRAGNTPWLPPSSIPPGCPAMRPLGDNRLDRGQQGLGDLLDRAQQGVPWLQFQVPPAWRLHLGFRGSPVQDRAEHTRAGGSAQNSRNCRADEAGSCPGKL